MAYSERKKHVFVMKKELLFFFLLTASASINKSLFTFLSGTGLLHSVSLLFSFNFLHPFSAF